MKLILLNGLPNSGKDSFYNVVSEYFKNIDIQRLAFGDTLKEIYSENCNIGIDDLYNKNKKIFIDGLISYANSVKRSLGQDYFVKEVYKKIDKCDILIITDFSNIVEYEFLRERDFDITTIKIITFDKPKKDRLIYHNLDGFDFDIILDNISTFYSYKLKCINIVKYIIESTLIDSKT